MNTTETQTTKNDTAAAQQECGPKIEPQKEHQWLQRLVGKWSCEGEAMMKPDQPPVKWKASEVVRSIGSVWIVGEGTGEVPEGGESITMVTLGYDPQKKRYVGTFVGSMMTNLWVYDGQLDAEGKVLTLDTEGPAMGVEGKIAKYRDVIEVNSDNHRTLTSFVQDDDGNWLQIMSANYHRIL